ncbi:YraN family protein [bacterium]|nr:MAG: YraN family protein [bacterium]
MSYPPPIVRARAGDAGATVPSRSELGARFERVAADYLRDRGWTIVTRRWRGGGGELDLIALDGDTLVFVEVKASFAPGFAPEDQIGEVKRRRIAAAIRAYLVDVGESEDRPMRLDLIAFDGEGMRHVVDILSE